MKRVYLFESKAYSDDRPDNDYGSFTVPSDSYGMFKLVELFDRLKEVFDGVAVVCDDSAESDDFTQIVSKNLKLVYWPDSEILKTISDTAIVQEYSSH